MSTRGARGRWLERAGMFCAAALMALCFFALRRDWLWDDGPHLVAHLTLPQSLPPLWYHVGYLPAAFALELLLPKVSPRTALELLSALSGGFGLLALHACLRRLGFERRAVLSSVVLIATTPLLFFHCTLIEVHGFAFAGASCAAWCAASSAGRRSAMRFVLGWLCGLCALAAHESHLLLLPCYLLLLYVRAEAQSSAQRARAVIPEALGMLVAFVLVQWIGTFAVRPGASSGANQTFHQALSKLRGFSVRYWIDEVLAPAPFVVLLGTILACFARVRGLALVSVSLGCLALEIAVFGVLNVNTRGGYLAAALVFWSVVIARGLEVFGRGARNAALLLSLVSLALAVRSLPPNLSSNERVEYAARLARMRSALPNGGVIVTLGPQKRQVSGEAPGFVEIELARGFALADQLDLDPAAYVATARGILSIWLHPGVPVAFETFSPLGSLSTPDSERWSALCAQLIDEFKLVLVELPGVDSERSTLYASPY